jgi:hypothetical protein
VGARRGTGKANVGENGFFDHVFLNDLKNKEFFFGHASFFGLRPYVLVV